MVKNRFFYISAFISIGIYLCLVVLVLLYITKTEPKRFNSFKKETVLELSIIVPQKKPKPIIKKHLNQLSMRGYMSVRHIKA